MKRILLILFLLISQTCFAGSLIGSGIVSSGGDITYDFTGTGALSADWTEESGGANGVTRVSDVGKGSTQYDTNFYVYVWETDAVTNDQFSEFEWDSNIGTSSNILGPAVRYTNDASNDGYYAYLNAPGGIIYIASINAGARTTISGTYVDSGLTFTNGDVFKLVATGTTIAIYQNGNLISSGTDSTYSSGYAGFMYRGGGSTADMPGIDNFRAGDGNGL